MVCTRLVVVVVVVALGSFCNLALILAFSLSYYHMQIVRCIFRYLPNPLSLLTFNTTLLNYGFFLHSLSHLLLTCCLHPQSGKQAVPLCGAPV